MNTLAERLSEWNKRMNNIPRKCLIMGLVVACCYIAVLVFPYCWPFVVALFFSSLFEPIARLIRRALRKVKAARIIATLLCMLLLYGLLTTVVLSISGRAFREFVTLLKTLPDIARTVVSALIRWASQLLERYSYLLPDDFQSADLLSSISAFLNNVLSNIVSTAANLSTKAASLTISTVASLPIIILSILFIIMGTFYFSYDRERIFGFFRRIFPEQVVRDYRLIKDGVFRSIFGQIRAQIFISFVLMLIIITGLVILKRPYALLLGILIGVADVLPVIGAGLFLNSWALLCLLLQDYYTAAGLFILYLCTITVRQIIEPRIVGKQLGLYPLVTMASMYAGFQFMGTIGLIAGPLVANICRVALDADAGKLGKAVPPMRFSQIFQKLFHFKRKKK